MRFTNLWMQHTAKLKQTKKFKYYQKEYTNLYLIKLNN